MSNPITPSQATTPPGPPPGMATRACMLVLAPLINLLRAELEAAIAGALAALEALLAQWRDGTLPPMPAPRPHATLPTLAPRQQAPNHPWFSLSWLDLFLPPAAPLRPYGAPSAMLEPAEYPHASTSAKPRPARSSSRVRTRPPGHAPRRVAPACLPAWPAPCRAPRARGATPPSRPTRPHPPPAVFRAYAKPGLSAPILFR